MSPQAKTIQIFLPQGNPRGIRSAEMTTRTVRVIEVPRMHIKDFLTMSDALQVGLYFLVGSHELNGLPQLYIGQTGELRRRLDEHNKTKDSWEWERAFVMLSTNNTITQTHALYLEYKAIETAKNAERYELLNGNNGMLPHAPAPLKADCEELFYTLNILLSTLGQPIFESLSINNNMAHSDESSPVVDAKNSIDIGTAPTQASPTKPEPMMFYCKTQGTSAKGYYDNDGFVVLSGSLIRKRAIASASSWAINKRDEMLAAKKLIGRDSEFYKLTENLLCKTPSGASDFVLGSSSNGWNIWKNFDGHTLDSIYR
ncbi:GIY-YIG nuclease family protein [Psychrobacter sp. LV10R520-6]|uniref:GIY-YIG nuclease family protein n=1 Tax=Psychrobacter sp. LV10R520-6 TaxID=1415574 RepID=UPI0024CB3CA0|nr:GIY-YIG nuclease family protein [Psychrobacter sp. LV10R520-6]SNT70856.1 GIY-YIG catalytic domain-containing protein [Psychrobacter sp. LV10R520-6]